MKVTVICEVKDNADYALKYRCISEQTSHDFKAVFVCNAHVDMSDSVEADNLCIIVKDDKNANWDIIIKLIDSSYVIFIAEQDFVSVDYTRMIVKAAEEKGSDIVSCDIAYGNVVADEYVYSNLSPLRSILVEYDNKKLKEMYSKYASDSADIGMLYGKCIRTELLKEACKEKIARDRARGIVGRPLRAMVAGIPNVGKSTFINSFAGRASAKTGNKPGVTRGKQWIRMGGSVELLDTPGILWPKFDNQEIGMRLALVGAIRNEILDRVELAIWLLDYLQREYPGAVEKKYLTCGDLPELSAGGGLPDGLETAIEETAQEEAAQEEAAQEEAVH